MEIPKVTKENCRRLAVRVVEDMDIDALIEYAQDGIEEWYYRHCPQEIWEEDWKLNFSKEEW